MDFKHSNNVSNNTLYGMGFIGAVIYYLSTATTIGAGIFGIVKGIFWPAFVVYELLKYFGM